MVDSLVQKKNLVIIGGGFAGATLAAKLEKRLPENWEVYLLSKTNFVTFNPLLPEVVGASVLPGHVQAPLRLIARHTRIRMVEAYEIDYEKNTVRYQSEENGEIAFDELVFSAGVSANMNILDGLAEHALPLKTVGDALFIRNRAIERLEQATIHPDPIRRKELTTFAIIGGGFSGVEVAGELEDFLRSAQKYYKNVEYADCRVIILHGTDHLLPELSEKLGKKTEKIFKRRGIRVHLNTRASKIENEKIVLTDGSVINAANIICTIGTAPHTFLQHNEALPTDRGRIIVEPDMSVKGSENLWALGDCALVPNKYDGKLSPPTAQFADRQARFLAKNIISKIKGKPTREFSYKPAGMLASIGHNNAVAEIYGLRMSGIIAFFIWRAIYLAKVPTLQRKTRLFLEWTWSVFFPHDIAHLGFSRTTVDPQKKQK